MVFNSCFTATLFSDFRNEYCFRDESMGGFALGDFLDELGKSIALNLDHLSQIVRALVSRKEWCCHWEGEQFHLVSSLMHDVAAEELYQGFRDASLFPAHQTRKPVWHTGEKLEQKYCSQGALKFRVLDSFDIEMEFSGIRQTRTPYAGYEPALVEWPARGFDLASHLARLGERINLRLATYACFCREVVHGELPWNFVAVDQSLLLLARESLAELEIMVKRCDLPLHRVELIPTDEAMRQIASVDPLPSRGRA